MADLYKASQGQSNQEIQQNYNFVFKNGVAIVANDSTSAPEVSASTPAGTKHFRVRSNGTTDVWNGAAWVLSDESVMTVEQVRLLNSTLPKSLITSDFGGGEWLLDASDTTTADDTGTVLVTASGKRYKRIYDGIVSLIWFGAIPNSPATQSDLINSIFLNYPSVYVPDGIYKGNFEVRSSNHTIYLGENAVFDANVFHVAIGFGPGVDNWVDGDPTVIVENVRFVGTLKVSGRIGSYYCNNIHVDKGHILESGYSNLSRGVHIYIGSKNMYFGEIKTSQTNPLGNYGFSFDGYRFDLPESIPDGIYIGKLHITTACTKGFQLYMARNIQIEQLLIDNFGTVDTAGNKGAQILACDNVNIGSMYVNGISNLSTLAQNVFISGNTNLNIGELHSINSLGIGIQVDPTFTDANNPSGKTAENVSFGNIFVENSALHGLYCTTPKVRFGNIFARNNNSSSTSANSQVQLRGFDGTTVENITIIDPSNLSLEQLTVKVGSVITIGSVNIKGSARYGLLLGGTTYVNINSLVVDGCVDNMRYDGDSYITVNSTVFKNHTGVDIINAIPATSMGNRIAFLRGTVWTNSPYSEVGFVKLNVEYGTAIPTTLQSYRGEIIRNSSPSVGTPTGWICTASGIPGTWSILGAAGMFDGAGGSVYGSTSTGFSHYNTVDQTTNYERVRGQWISNVYTLQTEIGGTGTARPIAIKSTGRTFTIDQPSVPKGFFNFNVTTGGAASFVGVNGSMTGTNTFQRGLAIVNTVAQSSTATGAAIWVSPLLTSLGASYNLIDLGSNSAADGTGTHTSLFKVDNLGNTTMPSVTATLDFGSIAANSELAGPSTITFTGAAVGDRVVLSAPNTVGIVYKAIVTAPNTITIYGCNFTTGAIDPPSGSFKVNIIK